MKAAVLLSGGLDSAVALYEAASLHGWAEVMGVSFLYGQKHSVEVERAERLCDYHNLPHTVVTLPTIFGGTESVLIKENQLQMPEMSYADIEESYGVSPTYVPYRNANLISMATTIAMVNNADEVWVGMHAEDAHNWAYPDCTPEFLGAMAAAIYVGSYHKVRLVAQHMNRTKADIVRVGYTLGVPFEMTMSCYEGKEPACGVCPTCVGRINAFRANNLKDPLEYEIEINWS